MRMHKTWWGEAFVQSLVAFIDEGRLTRGRAYRTDKRVLSFAMDGHAVRATIRGNINPYFGVYKEPKYNVSLNFVKLGLIEWQQVIKRISEHPGWMAKLMMNEIPSDIDDAFTGHGLLPKQFSDISASCSCPDYENPCKHIAGIYYRIANMLDSDPMLLFPLHGMPIKDLQKELQKSDLGKAFAEHLNAPEDIEFEISKNRFAPLLTNDFLNTKLSQQRYWCMPEWKMEPPATGEPISASMIKKQGDYPPFWTRQNSFVAAMEMIYDNLRIKNRKGLL